MLYTRWSDNVTIIENCGTHTVSEFRYPITLVKVHFNEDGSERYRILETMKADGGWPELDAALSAAPKVELTHRELRRAVKEAM